MRSWKLQCKSIPDLIYLLNFEQLNNLSSNYYLYAIGERIFTTHDSTHNAQSEIFIINMAFEYYKAVVNIKNNDGKILVIFFLICRTKCGVRKDEAALQAWLLFFLM